MGKLASWRWLVIPLLVWMTGCQAGGQKMSQVVASGGVKPIASDKARIYVFRQAAEYGSLYAPITYIDDRKYYVIRQAGVYIHDVVADRDIVFLAKGGGGIITTGTYRLNLKPGEERFFEATYTTIETLSPGTKALSTILSGDSGTKRSFHVSEVNPAEAREKMKDLSLAQAGTE
ncbi:hypothetical protein FNB15_16675 [Ferrovibrio terrae]|uniref:DUF2846 domain-containing protein n=1 Tax=Ferrovibrio terrae TaxID=2594003 RepID=A0A516H4X5_9PROT|nr:hypothetical protein [Ferrovibrio terrae]QDO98807.1 hypothetical protein FNB15_16675 [Ferrovibrio terrae]